MIVELEIETDENGYFNVTRKVDPDVLWSGEVDVQLYVELLEPDNMVVYGSLDIDAADGSPSNLERKFRISSGKEMSLGNWSLSLDENIVVVSGRTQPILPKGALKFNIRVERS